MAKKTTKNSNEKVQLALDSHRWINTPVVYTSYGSTFNRFQQDIMLQVSGHLQNYLKQYLDDARYLDKELPKPIFTKEQLQNGIEPLKLQLSDLAIDDAHYDNIDNALDAIKELWVKYPVFDENTGIRKGDDWLPIFDRVFIPKDTLAMTDNEPRAMKYERSVERIDKDGNVIPYVPARRSGYIEVTINTKVAAYAFDMSKGYFNHLERIAYFCNSSHTSRIYLLLMANASRGVMSPSVPYMELKDHLGMIERKPKSDEIVNTKYEKFSQFKKLVLDVAKADMLKLAADNKTEITFDYEPVYRGFAKRGDPYAIKFAISRTDLGKAREMKLHRNANEDKLAGKLLKDYPTLNVRVIASLFKAVPDLKWHEFSKYVMTKLADIVEAAKPDNRDAFVVAVLRKWIHDNCSDESKALPDEVSEHSLFSESEMSGTADPEAILDAIQYELGNTKYADLFGTHARCTIGEGRSVTLYVPSSRVNVINEGVNDKLHIAKAVAKVIGDGANILVESL